jgi:collagenase-like PrtC family protease
MRYFTIAADFKNETIDAYEDLNNKYHNSKVIETYGQVTVGNVLNSGRPCSVLPQIDLSMLEKYINYCNKKGIKFNYTFNASSLGNIEFSEEGIKELYYFLESIYNIGVENLTITMPSIMELVKECKFKFKIKTSAICQVNSPIKADHYKALGVERIVIDEDITRKFDVIENICETFGEGVEMIVNSCCYKSCPYKMFHYDHEAHCTTENRLQTIKDYYEHRCMIQKSNDFRNVIKLNWVRPEDLNFYEKVGVKYFKIQGRQNVLKGNPVKTLEHYFTEDFNGNLMELITLFAPYNSFQQYVDNKSLDGFVEKFFQNPHQCKETCSTCNYCGVYAEKSMNKDKAIILDENTQSFYKNYDRFNQVIHSESTYRPIKKLVEEKDLKFDFQFN